MGLGQDCQLWRVVRTQSSLFCHDAALNPALIEEEDHDKQFLAKRDDERAESFDNRVGPKEKWVEHAWRRYQWAR